MPDGDLQDGLFHPMIHGQRHADGRDLYVAHDPVPGDIQKTVIPGCLLRGRLETASVPDQLRVVRPRIGQAFLISLLIQFLHRLRIAGDGSGLMKRIPVVADCGIQQQRQPYKEKDEQDKGEYLIFHIGLSLPLQPGRTSLPVCSGLYHLRSLPNRQPQLLSSHTSVSSVPRQGPGKTDRVISAFPYVFL